MSDVRILALTLADALGVDSLPYLHGEVSGERVACGALVDVVRLMRPLVGPWAIVHPSVEARAAIRAARDGVDVCAALTALRVLPDRAPRFLDFGPPTGAAAGSVYTLAMEVAVQLGVDDRPYLLCVDGDPLALAVGLLRETLALVPAGTVAPHVRAAIAAARLPAIAPTRSPVSLTAILAASGLRR